MANVLQPFGLRPKHSPSGIVRPQRFVVPVSDISNAEWPANIYQDDAVYFNSNSRLQVATATSAIVGSFMGVEYNDSTGRRTVSNQFNKSLISTVGANAGLGTNDVWFWIYTDPSLVFEIVVAGSATGGAYTAGSPPQILEGTLLSYAPSGSATSAPVNAVTGFSTGFGYVATTQTAGGAGLIVYNASYDFNPQTTYTAGAPTVIGGSGNIWSDSYPTVLVRLANAQFTSSVAGF